MRNVRVDILKALVSLLDGNLSYNGTNVPVYSGNPPEDVPSMYVQIGSILTVERGLKDRFGHTGSFDIQVIDSSGVNQSTPLKAETITSAVMGLVKPNVVSVLSLTNFDMVYLVLSNTNTAPTIFDTNTTYRAILQWSFEAIEKVVTAWILATGSWNDEGVWSDTDFWNDGV